MNNSTEQPLLEFHIHLANGSTHKFIQNDPVEIQHILQNITGKVFEQPTLIISCQNTVVTYQASAVAGLSFLMESAPEHLLPLMMTAGGGVAELQEIPEDDYKARQSLMQPIVAGQPLVMVQEVELTSGHRFWIEAHVDKAVSKMQERQILHSFFAQPALICRRLGGGISLWNRTQIVRISFCPKPEAPTSAWSAEFKD